MKSKRGGKAAVINPSYRDSSHLTYQPPQKAQSTTKSTTDIDSNLDSERDIYINDIYLKQINFDFKTSDIFLNEINNIFDSYDNTNKGVIDVNSKLFKNVVQGGKKGDKKRGKKGGESFSITDDDVKKYCENIANDEDDIRKYIVNPDDESSKISKSNLKNFIDVNRAIIEEQIDIMYNPRYTYEQCYTTDNNVNNKTTKMIKCYEYNEDIVKAYEKQFLDNYNKWQEFINKQNKYIKKLSIEKKRIIQDYTKPSSFDFYKIYKSNPAIDLSIQVKKFGDSFYPQINALFPDKIENYDSWLENDRYGKTKDTTITLSSDEWKQVLDKFIIDIDEIIINAPMVTELLYCYRGVSNHYIKQGEDYPYNNNLRAYKSERLSSYTLDFNIAKEFYNYGTTNSKSIYRTAIMPFSRILYVAPLSLIPRECEFISPTNTVFLYKTDTNGDIFPKTSYNNIAKTFGICSKDNSFNSLDTILFLTKQSEEYIQKIKNKDEATIEEIRQILKDNRSATSDLNIDIYNPEDLKTLFMDAYTALIGKKK
jgi:hypothetical protein